MNKRLQRHMPGFASALAGCRQEATAADRVLAGTAHGRPDGRNTGAGTSRGTGMVAGFWRSVVGALLATGSVVAAAQASPPPLPNTMSPEATRGLQALIAADLKSTKVPDPTDLAAWRRLQDHLAANNPRAEAAQAVLPKLGVSLIDAKLGGVPVIDVRPLGWDKADRRLMIYIHGGAFTVNSARSTVANAARLAAKSGIRVTSVDYTLAPGANWKIIQDQVLSVFKDLLKQGYRMTEMAIIGDSAGGNLATRTVLTLRDNGLGMPAAVVLWAPWSDLTDEGDTAITLKDAEPILSYRNILEPSARAYADGLDLKDPRVSPLYADFTKGFPPTLIQDSTRTTFLSTSVRLYRKLEAAGAQPELDLYEGMWHVFQADLVPEAETAVEKSAAFIATRVSAAKK
jgi:monoterpene epsilon-lactone hydrolase